MNQTERKELIKKIDEEIRIDKLFERLGLQQISRKGSNIYSVCPFHEGADNPTGFSYNVKKGFGYCFTQCHKKYSLADVVMQAYGYSFPQAINYLADLVGVEITFLSNKTSGGDNIAFLNQVKRANALKFEVEYEPFDEKVLERYVPKMHTKLRQEGFDHSVRDYFNIGFCMSGYLQNRITIPIDSYEGNIITVSGRSVLDDEDLEMINIPKYKIYHGTDKSRTLYNVSRAIPYIDITREVIVVEGFKSVWRLHQWDIRNVVATMGSSISTDQILILLKLGSKIVVCGDRDEAGKKLNNKVVKTLKKYSDVYIMDMYSIDVPEKFSLSDITKEQFEFLYANKKEVI